MQQNVHDHEIYSSLASPIKTADCSEQIFGKEFFRFIEEQHGLGCWFIRISDMKLYLSSGAKKLYFRTPNLPNALVTDRLKHCLSSEEKQEIHHLLLRIQSNKKPLEYKRKWLIDKEFIYILEKGWPYCESNGQLIGIAGISQLIDHSRREHSESIPPAAISPEIEQHIQHRIRNHLQLVISLHNLHTSSSADLGFSNINRSFSQRLVILSQLQDILLSDHRVHTIASDKLVGDVLSSALKFRSDSKTSIRLHTKLEAVELTTNQATLIGFILYEILHNSLQHAFIQQNRGMVSILMVPCGKNRYYWRLTTTG